MGIDDIRDRWTAFGWEVKDMNGDDMEDIIRTFRSIDYANHHPHLLVAHTTKGKGVSFMEGVPNGIMGFRTTSSMNWLFGKFQKG